MAGAFTDRLLAFSDNGDGNLLVVNGPETFLVPMILVDQIIAGGPDIAQFVAFNVAARLALAGKTSVQTAPNSGVADTGALSTLNAVSFKGY